MFANRHHDTLQTGNSGILFCPVHIGKTAILLPRCQQDLTKMPQKTQSNVVHDPVNPLP